MMRSLKNNLKVLFFPLFGLFLSTTVCLIAGNWMPANIYAAAQASPHWSYEGADSPTRWGQLSKDFALCQSGSDQSPIDLDIISTGEPDPIEFNYGATPLEVVNNGHSIQVNYGEGSRVKIAGETYDLLQFHFHTPSEHTIHHENAAMELHLVHRNPLGKLAVISVMMNKGAPNPIIQSIWSNIPTQGGKNAPANLTINAADLLPKDKTYYSYTGSLTTPPCSEAVQWNILTQPIQISDEQIATFATLYQANARPVQPTNKRMIVLH